MYLKFFNSMSQYLQNTCIFFFLHISYVLEKMYNCTILSLFKKKKLAFVLVQGVLFYYLHCVCNRFALYNLKKIYCRLYAYIQMEKLNMPNILLIFVDNNVKHFIFCIYFDLHRRNSTTIAKTLF